MIISFSEGEAAGEGGREEWERRAEGGGEKRREGGSAECRLYYEKRRSPTSVPRVQSILERDLKRGGCVYTGSTHI